MKDLLEIGSALKSQTFQLCAMATVVRVTGSAYRRPGARILIAPDGQTCGMISGGCLEHDVLEQARSVMQLQSSRMVRYDSTSSDDLIFGTGLGCNGVVDVLIEPVTPALRRSLADTLTKVQQSRRNGTFITVLKNAEDGILHSAHAFFQGDRWIGEDGTAALEISGNLLDRDDSFCEIAGEAGAFVFSQKLLPSIQLTIFGGWLDVVPVVKFAREIGFQVAVVDSCRRECSTKLFAEANKVILGSPREALDQLPFDDRTVALLMNHNFERDQEALAALSEVSIPYIGMLGPKRRQQNLLKALEEREIFLSPDFINTLHGPVGLDIGAKSPEEIALAIIAEIIATLNLRNAKSARDRAIPLHVNQPSLVYA